MGRWTREQIVREILQRESAGQPLSPSGRQGVDPTLYSAASRMFGSWRNAVSAAGIDPERVQSHERWAPARILVIIRTLARRPHPLPRAELQQRHGYLVEAARRCFGSWAKAVVAAGVDPVKLRRVAPWTKERVLEAILTRALNNEPLRSRTVQPRTLADAGAKFFGTWGSALAAAGLDPSRYVCRWPPAGCRMAADEPAAAQRHPAAAVNQDEPATERRTAETAHANRVLTVVCEVAGRRRKPQQRWSEEEIRKAILARLRERRGMNAGAVSNDESALYQAAKRRHGSWQNALIAAGG